MSTQKLSVVAYVYNPTMPKSMTGECSQILSHSGLYSEFQVSLKCRGRLGLDNNKYDHSVLQLKKTEAVLVYVHIAHAGKLYKSLFTNL